MGTKVLGQMAWDRGFLKHCEVGPEGEETVQMAL